MSFRQQKGLTIVELMVAMVLGLIVIGGVVSVLMANKRSFSSNEGLSQIQETARTAFELMARDIRQTGGTGCDNAQRMSNVLNDSAAQWWLNWNSVRGYDGGVDDPAVTEGTADTNRIAATDSLQLMGVDGNMMPVASHDALGTTIRIPGTTTPYVNGDLMIICDFDHSAIFQITNYDASANPVEISHETGTTSPGNCTESLEFPRNCAATDVYTFPQNSLVGRLYAVDWYVGANGRPDEGGRSLYRARLANDGAIVIEEMAAGVIDMQITYGRNATDAISTATALGAGVNWNNVNSVFITLTVESADRNVTTSPGVNEGRLRRTFTYVVTLRNRVS